MKKIKKKIKKRLDLSKRFRIFVNDKEKRFFFILRGGQMASRKSHKL